MAKWALVFIILLAIPSGAKGDLAEGLIAHLTFDEEPGSAAVADATGNGHDGKLNISPDADGLPMKQVSSVKPGRLGFRLMCRDVVVGQKISVAIRNPNGPDIELVEGTDFEASGNGVRIIRPDLIKEETQVITNYRYFNEGMERIEGPKGRALRFDGYNDWVAIPKIEDFDFPKGFTYAAWISAEKRTAAIEPFTTCSRVWGISFYGDKLHFIHEGIPTGIAPTKQRTVFKNFERPKNAQDEWFHLAVTADGSTIRLYINGKEVEVVEGMDGRIDPIRSGSLRIGGSNEYIFHGALGDIRIYNRALTPEEIAELGRLS